VCIASVNHAGDSITRGKSTRSARVRSFDGAGEVEADRGALSLVSGGHNREEKKTAHIVDDSPSVSH